MGLIKVVCLHWVQFMPNRLNYSIIFFLNNNNNNNNSKNDNEIPSDK